MNETHKVKHLLTDTTTDEKISFLNSFDYILSDCDGVVWGIWGAINGAGDGINSLKDHGKSVMFLSNNSVRTEANYLEKFQMANVYDITMDNIMTPAVATALYLKKNNFKGLIYAIGSTEFQNTLRNYGFSVIGSSNDPIEESFAAIWQQIKDKQPVRAVVMDTDLNVNYIKLTKALRFLKEPECLFVVGGTEIQIPVTSELDILGPGVFYQMIEKTAGRQAVVVGKPGIALKNVVMDKLNIRDPTRVLMIGDTLNQDIGFGVTCGFKTLLVLSGTTTLNELQTNREVCFKPDYYLNSLADFVSIYDAIKIQKMKL